MSGAGSKLKGRNGVTIITVLITINFVLLLLLISPLGRSRELYTAIRDSGFGPLATTWVPVWFALTTLIATVLYFWRKLRRQDVVEQPAPRRALDGVLLLGWWIAIMLACLYAFMMGMGG